MIVVLGGVSGSGKSTIGSLLARRLGWDFEDGDALHPPANVAKMQAGIPLTDADRWPWLRAIASWIDQRIAAGDPAVVACSALKRSYRDLLAAGRPEVRIVLLSVDQQELVTRLKKRHGHFFPAVLLRSQLSDLELPVPGEQAVAVPADGDPERVTDAIIGWLGLASPPR